MNKTLIALAIAAALPVAAQADVTLSGSVTTEYTQGGVITTDAALDLAATEVLANGMTATASLDVLGTSTQGTASLAGDFGTLTVGSIDSDGAFQAGDVGGAVGDSTDADEDSTSVHGVHFATSVAGLNIATQFNGSTTATGAVAPAATLGTQVSASYDLDGLSVGYAYASAGASTDTVDGLMAAQTAFGASYTFGDLVLSAGKSSIVADTLVSATYTMSMDALTIKAQVDNDPAGDYQVNVTYAVSDAISLNAEFDSSAANTIMGASYTSGSLTATVTKTDDAAGSTDASVALDYGNADVTLARDGGAQTTSLTYSVAF
jgi:hypothetical protein